MYKLAAAAILYCKGVRPAGEPCSFIKWDFCQFYQYIPSQESFVVVVVFKKATSAAKGYCAWAAAKEVFR